MNLTLTTGQARCLAFSVLALIASCSSGADPLQPSFGRLELDPKQVAVQAPESVVFFAWGDGELDTSTWSIVAEDSRLANHGNQQALMLDRTQLPVELRIPVSFKYGERMAVEIEGQGGPLDALIQVVLYQGERKVASQFGKLRKGKNKEKGLVLFPQVFEDAEAVEYVSILLPRSGRPFYLTKVSISTKPTGFSLEEQLFGGFELVKIEGDARRAMALVEGSVFATQVDNQGVGDSLQFSFGQTEQLEQIGIDGHIEVTISSQDGVEGPFTFPLLVATEEQSADNPRRWLGASIPLGDFPLGTLDVSFALTSSYGKATCLLEQPRHGVPTKLSKTVLLVTSDTHRSDHLGFLMEDGELETQAIDKLAGEGLAFLNALSSINNTTPSHAALMTGLSPRDTGLVANARRLSDEAPTLAEAFRDLGYATLASVSATPVKYELCNLGQGFDRYGIPATGVQDADETIGRMLDWLEDYEGQPVFAWVHVFDAHGPYEPPTELAELYTDGQKPGGPKPGELDIAAPWDPNLTDPDHIEGLYKGEITYLDGYLGKLFDLPRINQGVIALTADHGEVLRKGPGRPYDHRGLSLNTLAVPLILKAPGIAPGEQRGDPVRQVDIGRTLLDLTGNSGTAFPGRNLIETVIEVDQPRFAIEANGLSAAVITKKWMLVLAIREVPAGEEEVGSPLHSVLLYNVQEDKYCVEDVWKQNREMTKALRKLLLDWLDAGQGNQWIASDVVDAETIARDLANLGYLSMDDSEDSEWFDRSCTCDWCGEFSE
ncbi:MAG: arylsulfatase A-like enzyme [Planctomycetota bacterium]